MYYISLYNTGMKVLYISATAYTIYLMRKKKPYCHSYFPESDDFNHYKYIYPRKIQYLLNKFSCCNFSLIYPHLIFAFRNGLVVFYLVRKFGYFAITLYDLKIKRCKEIIIN